MIKMTLNFVIIGLIAIFAVWLADSGGLVSIEWIGYKSQISMSALVAFILFVSVIFIIILNFVSGLLDLFGVFKRNNSGEKKKLNSNSLKNSEFINVKNLDEGIISVFKTMGSISAGDLQNAVKNLKKVKKVFGSRPIIDILSLEIARLEKDFARIEKASKRLIRYENVEIIGLRAEIENYIEKKDYEKALASADRAFEIRGDLPWVVENTLNLRVRNKKWDEALEVLTYACKKKNVSTATFKRLKAIIFFEKAKEYLDKGQETKYFKYCSQALSLDPALNGASISLARYYVNNDNQFKKASKILMNAWKKNPMDEIVDEYMNLRANETPLEKVQTIEKFLKQNRKLESLNNKILAEYCVKAGLWGKAKAEIDEFLITNPSTKKIASLMVVCEEKLNNKQEAEKWKSQIEKSAEDDEWLCKSCGALSENWYALCPVCGDFGNHEWKMYVQDFEKDL